MSMNVSPIYHSSPSPFSLLHSPFMATKNQDLHILFFPLMAPGHMLPMINMAKLFANHGVRATILTTRANTSLIKPIILNSPVELALIPFPSVDVGLPAGCENLSAIAKQDLMPNFMLAISMLVQPFDQILRELHPNVLITDSFFPWTIDITSELGIPQLIFSGTGFFPLCLLAVQEDYKPHETLPAETKSFLVPGIPHRIELLKSQVIDVRETGKELLDFFLKVKEAEKRSYGVVVNSFYELEPDYAQHYRTIMGRRAWHIGPLSLCNEDMITSTTYKDHEYCLNWLDEKEPGSVIYVCFGSLSAFSGEQLREMALGLEASHHAFVWVVPKIVERDEGMDWMPDQGYEGRVNGSNKKGLLIKGWAPQLLILNHRAVGGFMTHCGWNSTLEGVCAGLPMITWPLFAEQFYNERLVVDVLKIGVAVGMKEYVMKHEDRPLIHGREIERAVSCVMGGGEEAEAMRKRARELGEMAKDAVKEGGSSFTELTRLIDELVALHP